jgi:hypothetical protein
VIKTEATAGAGVEGLARRRVFVAAAVAITVGIGIYVFVVEPIPLDLQETEAQWEEFIRGLVVRLFFLGIAGYVLAFTARNYRISKQLRIANEEKRNALNTFILFRESIPDPDVQSIVTAELVRPSSVRRRRASSLLSKRRRSSKVSQAFWARFGERHPDRT